jgi:hypothetical protein
LAKFDSGFNVFVRDFLPVPEELKELMASEGGSGNMKLRLGTVLS